MTVQSYRQLVAWQKAMELVDHVYDMTEKFPREELFGLTLQMRRASVSVPSNIAEGKAREHLREYLHHVSVAQGSLAELETQLEIAARLSYCSREESGQILEQAQTLARQLSAMRSALEQRLSPDS